MQVANLDFLPNCRVAKVEIGLFFDELMQVVRLSAAVPFPGWATKEAQLKCEVSFFNYRPTRLFKLKKRTIFSSREFYQRYSIMVLALPSIFFLTCLFSREKTFVDVCFQWSPSPKGTTTLMKSYPVIWRGPCPVLKNFAFTPAIVGAVRVVLASLETLLKPLVLVTGMVGYEIQDQLHTWQNTSPRYIAVAVVAVAAAADEARKRRWTRRRWWWWWRRKRRSRRRTRTLTNSLWWFHASETFYPSRV